MTNAAGASSSPTVASSTRLGSKPATPVTEIYDAGEHVVLPGLINTHHHFDQTLTRAYRPALDKELFDWLRALIESRAGSPHSGFGSRAALPWPSPILSGCTTAVDHHYVFPAGLENAIDIQMEEAQHLGLRVRAMTYCSSGRISSR